MISLSFLLGFTSRTYFMTFVKCVLGQILAFSAECKIHFLEGKILLLVILLRFQTSVTLTSERRIVPQRCACLGSPCVCVRVCVSVFACLFFSTFLPRGCSLYSSSFYSNTHTHTYTRTGVNTKMLTHTEAYGNL